jgi:S1/P1 Nuclease
MQHTRFPAQRDYSSLSVKDLIEARDHYHVHLAHLQNVVATGIGRYRIRKGDWYDEHPPSVPRPKNHKKLTGPRNFSNTVVRDWSWPCVLVFVDHWITDRKFFEHPDQAVPRSLYLPDGRVVPTCVVELKLSDDPIAPPRDFRFPRNFIGGGYPVLSQVQGREHVGSVGCLVTDGRMTYALTNRHVTGEADREIFSIIGGERVRVGTSDPRQIGKKEFERVYPGWPGANVFCNLDAGLIRIDDVARWTTQVLGVGNLARMLDLNTDTITLDLVDCPVRGFGGASGELYGTIAGFFYRYKSVGGFDYVADLIIAPRESPKNREIASTHPGDSGTLWCFEQPLAGNHGGAVEYRPIAVQWGGQVVVDNGAVSSSAHSHTLATALSTICRELDLDLVRDWNTGLPEYWGAVGHYAIAAIACAHVKNQKLKKLMLANLERISFRKETILKGERSFRGLSKKPFIPLADVPDYAWKGGHRKDEQPNHFADMDKPVEEGKFKGKTLLDLCKDEKNVDVKVWTEYYAAVHDPSKGTLPFRVWQIFSEMKRFAGAKDVVSFVAAAGVLAHYVGDACQPLHLSYMFNGEPTVDADGHKTRRGVGVHHAYEAQMFNSFVADLWQGIQDELEPIPSSTIKTGRAAAVATVRLMQETFALIKPRDLVDAFVKNRNLWELFGDLTKETMANGVRALAHLWESAWREGGGNQIGAAKLVLLGEKELEKRYDDPDFLPSHRIKDIATVLGP